MQSTNVYFCLLLVSIAVYSGQAFTSQVQSTTSQSTALYGKRQKLKTAVKNIFGGVDEQVPTATKVKLSDGKAKGLAKKYKDIDCLEEKAYQILVDLKMV